MDVQHIAAFALGATGGNPAGVVLLDTLPEVEAMQKVAAELGYSETVFAAPAPGGWRVRYFAPTMEVPFCGHATIALGAALARQVGEGVHRLLLNETEVTVEGEHEDGRVVATLVSPPTWHETAPAELVQEALALFGYAPEDLDPRLPPALIGAGARHLLLALSSRERLATMAYELTAGATLMRDAGLVTIMLVQAESPHRFHARNAFAAGGVAEDPATGAAAAAFAGYLRALRWPHGGAIEILQGQDMGMPSLLRAEIPPVAGAGIRVSGAARLSVDPLPLPR